MKHYSKKLLVWAFNLCKKMLPPEVRAGALQDFERTFQEKSDENGILAAYFWFCLQILQMLPSVLFERSSRRSSMFKNYLKIALRNLIKHKLFSSINIAGFAVGYACFILIVLWVNNEISYDRFHENADRIFRITSGGTIGGTEIRQALTPTILPSVLKSDFPEVEQTVTMSHKFDSMCRYKDKVINEYNIIAADSTFFDVFSFKLIKGNPQTALREPHSVVLTEATVNKYFGDEDPIGKVLIFDERLETIVTGVVENVPEKSHFHFDILLSYSSLSNSRSINWRSNDSVTYILLQEGYSHELLEAKFPDFILQYIHNGDTSWFDRGNTWQYLLQPLTDIHLNSDIEAEYEPNGNAGYVYIFTIAAFMILLIACINFMNLTTAKYSLRAKEIGIRKTVGSTRKQLILQFLSESILISIIAFITGILVIVFTLPHFNNFTGKELALYDFDLLSVCIFFICAVIFTGLIAGSYPALFLSSFKPAEIIRDKTRLNNKKSWLRNILVISQLSALIVLTIGTFIIGKQLDFLRNTTLGFEKENVIVIKSPGTLGAQVSAFKTALAGYSKISSVAGSYSMPGTHFINSAFAPENSQRITLNITFCEPEFLETMKLEMSEGRFFSRDFTTDSTAIIINETALKLLGWDDPIGKTFTSLGHTFNVIGIVKDMHYKSMHQIVRPMALLNLKLKLGWPEKYIAARLNMENIEETVNFIRNSWKSFSGGKPFEYSFLDEDYVNLYKSDIQTGRVFLIFSFISVFIASLGLFGLTSFTASQRKKEIGIRKVLGSSIEGIVLLLSKEFLKWIIFSYAVAWPLAYFIMNKWLQSFAYKVDLGIWPFVITGIITAVVTIITISYRIIKAAIANPVESLRYE